MIVENTQSRVIFIGGMEGVKFLPGHNALTQSDIDFLESRPKYEADFKEREETGTFVVRSENTSKSAYKYEGIKAAELKALIPTIFDKADLESIIENGSAGNKKLAKQQIEKIDAAGITEDNTTIEE